MLAAIIFVATTGCTWHQLPPVFGPSGPAAHGRAQQDAVWNRQQLANQLRSLLREYFPAVLTAF